MKIGHVEPLIGRRNRANFWGNYVVMLISGMIVYFLALKLSSDTTGADIGVGMTILLGSIYLEIGRLHDTDRSGWNVLYGLIPIAGPIILLVFFLQKGTNGPNRYGDVSKKNF